MRPDYVKVGWVGLGKDIHGRCVARFTDTRNDDRQGKLRPSGTTNRILTASFLFWSPRPRKGTNISPRLVHTYGSHREQLS